MVVEHKLCTVVKPFGNGVVEERGLFALYQGAHIQEDRFELMLEAKNVFCCSAQLDKNFLF